MTYVQNIYTDLALEMAEQLSGGQGGSDSGIDGVEISVENNEVHDIKVTVVQITNDAGEAAMGKPRGNYITIESPEIMVNNVEAHEEIISILANKLAELTKGIKKSGGSTLVIGLGNRDVTPDALGPKVVSKVLVTRHIMESLPQELAGGLAPLCALAPGVMGTTGIETAEVVRGLVEHIKPALVICIDALAARKISRINQTIQLADTGISPGAGVGNKRMSLNQQSLGIPVIAIGVPTVTDVATFVNDAMDLFLSEMSESTPESLQDGAKFFDMLQKLEDRDKYAIIRNILQPYVGNMFVTPKEIGEVVGWLANIIANSINIATHEGISREDINRFMY
ncbi:MAG: GPR endopeptidase [Defluviitaleaceae bacterium]|nr:GPR endopeptidase [Defluviitaleaceae bacterium]